MLLAKIFAEGLNGGTFSVLEKKEDIIRFRRKKVNEAKAWENYEYVENILKYKIKYRVQWIQLVQDKIRGLQNTVTDI
jgi:hypothetical protein